MTQSPNATPSALTQQRQNSVHSWKALHDAYFGKCATTRYPYASLSIRQLRSIDGVLSWHLGSQGDNSGGYYFHLFQDQKSLVLAYWQVSHWKNHSLQKLECFLYSGK